jgi:hypothetical protein
MEDRWKRMRIVSNNGFGDRDVESSASVRNIAINS